MMNKRFRIGIVWLVLCSLIFCSCACAKPARQPEQVAEAVLTYIRDGRMKKAMALMHNPEDFVLGQDGQIDLNEALMQHLSWSLGQKQYDAQNDYYMIEAQITMVDIAAVMGELMTKYFDSMLADASLGVSWQDDDLAEELTRDLEAMITSADAPLCTTTVHLYVVPDPKGDWLLFVEDTFINAVTGGVLQVYEFYSYGA